MQDIDIHTLRMQACPLANSLLSLRFLTEGGAVFYPLTFVPRGPLRSGSVRPESAFLGSYYVDCALGLLL